MLLHRRNTICNLLLQVGLLASVALGAASSSQAAINVTYTKSKVAGVSVNVVTANLNSPDVCITPAVARWGVGSCEPFRSMMKRTRPAAAIDGTFFCTRTLKPTGDIVIGGQLVWKGCLGTAIAVDYGGQVHFLPTRGNKAYHWYEYDQVLAAGPTLILGGKTLVMPKIEGFRSGVHYTQRARAAVGLTYHNKLVFVTTRQRIYYRQLAKVMKRLQCMDAAVLDGGSSIGLYCKGKLINNPTRGMTNCLLVYDNRDSYEQHKDSFYPFPQSVSR